jgi:N-acetyl-gamma-glutamyl-phosphate reductase
MSMRVGIVGVSGYGGGEALRLLASHPSFELVYAAGESSAGARLSEKFPGISPKLADLTIEKWDPAALPKLDVLFASLPTGASAEPLARVPRETKIVDIGGDHRYVEGWTYGLADVWPERIRTRVARRQPRLLPRRHADGARAAAGREADRPSRDHRRRQDPASAAAGRGGGDSKFGYAEVNEDTAAYGLLKHTHMPEISATIAKLAGRGGRRPGLHAAPGPDDARHPRDDLRARPGDDRAVASTRPGGSTRAGRSSA